MIFEIFSEKIHQSLASSAHENLTLMNLPKNIFKKSFSYYHEDCYVL